MKEDLHSIGLFERLCIELTSFCNRKCWFCPRSYDTSGKRIDKNGKHVREFMKMEKVLHILDQAQEMGFKGIVTNHHLSEPFTDKRVIEVAIEVKKRGMKNVTNTNGDHLRNHPALCRQIAALFDVVVVGIYDPLTSEEIEKEKEGWQKRLLGTKVFFSVITEQEPRIRLEEGAFPRVGVPYDKRMIKSARTYPKASCHRPLEQMFVHYDGNVGLCCEDYRDEFDLGNAFEKPIREIWFSTKHIRIVQDLIKGERTRYKLCKECYMPGTKTTRGCEPRPRSVY